MKARTAQIERRTTETQISARLRIDGEGRSVVDTGIPFFDHMLTLFARHALLDLRLHCRGDLAVDAHHTVEDCGLVLGQAFARALGDKKGIRRYGAGFDPRNPLWGEAFVPMDECLARCVIDFGGRPCLVWRGLDRLAYKVARAERAQDMSSAFRLGQVALRLDCGHAAHAGRGDRLAIDMIRAIARHEYAPDARLGAAPGNDIAVGIQIELSLEDVCVGHVADGDEDAAARQMGLRPRLDLFEPDTRDLVLGDIENLGHHRVPDRFDLGVGQHPVSHDLRGAQLVASMD